MRMLLAAALILASPAQRGPRTASGRARRRTREASIGLKDIDTNGDGRAQVSELQGRDRPAFGQPEAAEKKKERREEGSIELQAVDANKDGRVTLPELQSALEKAREGGERKEEGKKKRD
jgi:hypothetical protein